MCLFSCAAGRGETCADRSEHSPGTSLLLCIDEQIVAVPHIWKKTLEELVEVERSVRSLSAQACVGSCFQGVGDCLRTSIPLHRGRVHVLLDAGDFEATGKKKKHRSGA